MFHFTLAIDYLRFAQIYKNIIMEKIDSIGGLYGFRTGKPPRAFGILFDHHPNSDDSFYIALDFLACYTTFLPKHICFLIFSRIMKTQLPVWLWNAIDWVFPPHCLGCGIEGEVICPECYATIKRVPANVCPYCNAYVSTSGHCPKCMNRKPAYKQFRAFAFYGGVIREAIHHLKYQNDVGVARVLASYLLKVIQAENWEFDLVVPVPLSRKKQEQRGYNQAERLAQPVAAALGKPISTQALSRIRENASQVDLDVKLRRENVRGVFEADPAIVKGKRILLIDDVFTTGATLESASQALRDAKSDFVYTVTVGRSEFNID